MAADAAGVEGGDWKRKLWTLELFAPRSGVLKGSILGKAGMAGLGRG